MCNQKALIRIRQCPQCDEIHRTYTKSHKALCLDCKVNNLRERGYSKEVINRMVKLEKVKLKEVKNGRSK